MFADALVVLATAAVVGPALVRAFRLRTGAGLSAGTQSAALAMGCIWLGYYMHAGLHLAVVTGSASLVMYLTLTFLAWRSGGERDTP